MRNGKVLRSRRACARSPWARVGSERRGGAGARDVSTLASGPSAATVILPAHTRRSISPRSLRPAKSAEVPLRCKRRGARPTAVGGQRRGAARRRGPSLDPAPLRSMPRPGRGTGALSKRDGDQCRSCARGEKARWKKSSTRFSSKLEDCLPMHEIL